MQKGQILDCQIYCNVYEDSNFRWRYLNLFQKHIIVV